MSKVITVTLNPAIDQIMEVPDFHIGETASVQHSYSYPAGKGVNVSRALACLHQPSVALGIVNEKDEEFFNSIVNDCLTTDWVTTDTPTRNNVSIYDTQHLTVTHLRNTVQSEEKFPTTAIINKLQSHCINNDIVVLSGSLPKNAPADTLFQLCEACRKMEVKVIVDSSGEAMDIAVQASPYMIKPNLDELREMTGKTLKDEEEIMRTICQISTIHNIDVVLASMGEAGSIMYDRKEDRLYKGQVKVEADHSVLHSVGSGDAMIAGFCSELLQTGNIVQALKNGTAAGAANLLTKVPGELSAADVEQLKEKVLMWHN